MADQEKPWRVCGDYIKKLPVTREPLVIRYAEASFQSVQPLPYSQPWASPGAGYVGTDGVWRPFGQ